MKRLSRLAALLAAGTLIMGGLFLSCDDGDSSSSRSDTVTGIYVDLGSTAKTTYTAGDKFSTTGITVYGLLNNYTVTGSDPVDSAKVKNLTNDKGITYTAGDTTLVNDTTEMTTAMTKVTVKYGNYSDSFDITVNAAEDTTPTVLVTKTLVYENLGDTFSAYPYPQYGNYEVTIGNGTAVTMEASNAWWDTANKGDAFTVADGSTVYMTLVPTTDNGTFILEGSDGVDHTIDDATGWYFLDFNTFDGNAWGGINGGGKGVTVTSTTVTAADWPLTNGTKYVFAIARASNTITVTVTKNGVVPADSGSDDSGNGGSESTDTTKATAKTYDFVGLSESDFLDSTGAAVSTWGNNASWGKGTVNLPAGTTTVKSATVYCKEQTDSTKQTLIRARVGDDNLTTALNYNGGDKTSDFTNGVTISGLDRYISIPVTVASEISVSCKFIGSSGKTGTLQAVLADSDGKLLGELATAKAAEGGEATLTGEAKEATTVYIAFSRNGAGGGGLDVTKIEVTPSN